MKNKLGMQECFLPIWNMSQAGKKFYRFSAQNNMKMLLTIHGLPFLGRLFVVPPS
jgi:hypothetical protein